jgi:hypothetical protein
MFLPSSRRTVPKYRAVCTCERRTRARAHAPAKSRAAAVASRRVTRPSPPSAAEPAPGAADDAVDDDVVDGGANVGTGGGVVFALVVVDCLLVTDALVVAEVARVPAGAIMRRAGEADLLPRAPSLAIARSSLLRRCRRSSDANG